MSLVSLAIHNVRNLSAVKIAPSCTFNIVYGANGSGKTSLLEAIYYLGLGRSFRTRLNTRIVHQHENHFSIFAHLQQEHGLLPIGLERHVNGTMKIRIAETNVRSIYEITQSLPIQLLNPDSRQLLTGASKLRRQFIDWGVFHVEPTFLAHWQHAQRALKQRNAALKENSSKNLISLWDIELDLAATALNNFRKAYLEKLLPIFFRILTELLDSHHTISIKYKCGWDESLGLRTVLEQSLPRDLQVNFTQYGPHRADMLIRIDDTIPAHELLSQGQQKLVVYALQLAQGTLLKKQMGKSCVYLLDDLPAELDCQSRKRVSSALKEMEAQVFVTTVERSALSDFECIPGAHVFRMEQGTLKIHDAEGTE